MTKFAAAFALLVLAACGAEEEETIEEKFRRTEAAIEKTAADLEAKSENAVRTTEELLENRAGAFENSIEAAEPAEGNAVDGNETH
ncbi:MAG TPA: hypothetical protein VFO69_03895 [Allosphingosinicella sp.]|nr:hypothetical protein [Allosphingosinicella sp.]